jgi:hypothetical protein
MLNCQTQVAQQSKNKNIKSYVNQMMKSSLDLILS